jgi:hypothetical protein
MQVELFDIWQFKTTTMTLNLNGNGVKDSIAFWYIVNNKAPIIFGRFLWATGWNLKHYALVPGSIYQIGLSNPMLEEHNWTLISREQDRQGKSIDDVARIHLSQLAN